MIIINKQGMYINNEFFPEEVCLQVLPTWGCDYDEIGLRGDTLYGKTNHTQHGINEHYRTVLLSYKANIDKFREATTSLAKAKTEARSFASQAPLIKKVRGLFKAEGPSLLKYGDIYVRRWWWKRGEGIPGHTHTFDHVSLLCRGSAKVVVDGVESTYVAPIEVIMRKDKEHRIEALENDTVWFCVFGEHGGDTEFTGAHDPLSD